MLVLIRFLVFSVAGSVLGAPEELYYESDVIETAMLCDDPHAVYKKCLSPCPSTCAHRSPQACNKKCISEGCECAPGYILSEIGGSCLLTEDCPGPTCPKHAHYVQNDNNCTKTCGNRLIPGTYTSGTCRPFTGCICDQGYVRKYDNGTGPCIHEEHCPQIPKCSINNVPTSCKIKCPPQSCESMNSSYYCVKTECEPGCDCIKGYLRRSDGICIPSQDCFKKSPDCGPHEVATDCTRTCPPQSCESLFYDYNCVDIACTPGCNCIEGYLRNGLGLCIPNEACENDTTIACDGDRNATHVPCGDVCPVTCAEPDNNIPCIEICVLNGCKCKPGYLLSEKDGVCIDPRDCPGGSPKCGANQSYVNCKVGCSKTYCPKSDSRLQEVCVMPEYPCLGGCACFEGHLHSSDEDSRCILASECPPVNCTRPNEKWNPSPSNCFQESCEDKDSICYNNNTYANPPRCVCMDGYYRNESDICVPVSECRCGGDPNAMPKACPSLCPPTCGDMGNINITCLDGCDPSGCVCKPGYILIERGGFCIKPENCPEIGCNGDPNAMHGDCPIDCPPTCGNLYNDTAELHCTQECDPSGCVCKSGFILTKAGGICVRPEDCSVELGCNGDINAIHTYCTSSCPTTCENWDKEKINISCTNLCVDNLCVCKPGYILSDIAGVCIKPDDCSVHLGCKGDANATHADCPSACPPTCSDLNVGSARMACPEACDPSSCTCKPGYVLTKKGGVCISPADCPDSASCYGDRNATRLPCVDVCPSTCAAPNSNRSCIVNCMLNSCKCNPGYLLSEKGGFCIEPQDCPGGSPICGVNETYADCNVGCPANYCPKSDTRVHLVCAFPTYPCPSGCACKEGYFRISDEDSRCVLGSECPPLKCTRQNEVWDPEPSSCFLERCQNRGSVCDRKRPAAPRCVCMDGYYRNDSDICVSVSECMQQGCNGDPNATHKDCPSICPPTCDSLGNEKLDFLCGDNCDPSGCECKPGYILSEKGGFCVRPEDCSAEQACRRDLNATHTDCISSCPTTCSNQYLDRRFTSCNTLCDDNLCMCKPTYILSEVGGVCIKPEDCPVDPGCKGDPNASVLDCPSACATTCTDLNSDRVSMACPNDCDPSGCVCKPGFVLKERGGVCVRPEDCPAQQGCNGDLNATHADCPSPCPSTCGYIETDIIYADKPFPDIDYLEKVYPDEFSLDRIRRIVACPDGCDPSGCVCKPDYILTKKGGVCVKPVDCPGKRQFTTQSALLRTYD